MIPAVQFRITVLFLTLLVTVGPLAVRAENKAAGEAGASPVQRVINLDELYRATTGNRTQDSLSPSARKKLMEEGIGKSDSGVEIPLERFVSPVFLTEEAVEEMEDMEAEREDWLTYEDLIDPEDLFAEEQEEGVPETEDPDESEESEEELEWKNLAESMAEREMSDGEEEDGEELGRSAQDNEEDVMVFDQPLVEDEDGMAGEFGARAVSTEAQEVQLTLSTLATDGLRVEDGLDDGLRLGGERARDDREEIPLSKTRASMDAIVEKWRRNEGTSPFQSLSRDEKTLGLRSWEPVRVDSSVREPVALETSAISDFEPVRLLEASALQQRPASISPLPSISAAPKPVFSGETFAKPSRIDLQPVKPSISPSARFRSNDNRIQSSMDLDRF